MTYKQKYKCCFDLVVDLYSWYWNIVCGQTFWKSVMKIESKMMKGFENFNRYDKRVINPHNPDWNKSYLPFHN